MLKKYTQDEYDHIMFSTFFYSFFSWIFLVLFFVFLYYFMSFESYCTSNWWQYLLYSESCYIDWNYFHYIYDFEKHIFEKNLSTN